MMLLTISEFIGRFHPVLVHLPVGILLLAVIFYFLSYKKEFEWIKPAVQLSLLIGVLAALASCITGYLLSNSGDYDASLVTKHQWFGIAITAISLITYYIASKKFIYLKWLMPLIGVLLIITGHLGGSITHGEGYLTKAFTKRNKSGEVATGPINDVQQAVVYSDIIQPILEAKCYSCHGASKQKGKLRLDAADFILKGGEGGNIIKAGNADESELMKRILLALDNEEHMPPKEKSQLNKAQMQLLKWWINSGADFHKQAAALHQPKEILPYLTALQTGNNQQQESSLSDIPVAEVMKAPDSSIQKLKLLDVSVTPVAINNNYLSVSFFAVDNIGPQQIQLLKNLSKQIVWLKLSGSKLSDEVCAAISQMPNLTRLFLNHTNITDRQLSNFKNCSQLQYLNLTETGVTVNGIRQLSSLKNIRQLYLYQTKMNAVELSSIKNNFPNAVIDTGGYQLQFLATDTMKVKAKPINM